MKLIMIDLREIYFEKCLDFDKRLIIVSDMNFLENYFLTFMSLKKEKKLMY